MKMKNLFTGLIFIFLGAAIILSRLGFFAGIGMFDLVVTILLIPVLIYGIKNREYSCIFFSLAVAAILYDRELGIEMLTPWPILGAALCLSIGMYMIFPRFEKIKKNNEYINPEFKEEGKSGEEEEIYICKTFSGCTQYINSSNIREVNINISFSSVELYFDNAGFSGDAKIRINSRFSNLELYIPKRYRVEFIDNHFSSFKEEIGKSDDVVQGVIVLEGKAIGSNIEVNYI